MRHNDKQLGKPSILYTGTKAEIEALDIVEGMVAYATDTDEIGTASATEWTWGQGKLWDITDGSSTIDNVTQVTVSGGITMTRLSAGSVLLSTNADTDTGGVSPFVWNIDGSLAVKANAGMSLVIPQTMAITKVSAHLKTLGTAGSTIIDINKNGTTIFTNQANRPTITYSAYPSYVEVTPDVVGLDAGDIVTIDIDQAATGASGLTIVLTIGTSSVKVYEGVYNELITASGTSFTTNNVYLNGTLRVYLNGVRQDTSHFDEGVDLTSFTTDFTVLNTDILTVDYDRYTGTASSETPAALKVYLANTFI